MSHSMWRGGVVCACLALANAISGGAWAVNRTWTGGDGEWVDDAGAANWSGLDEPDSDDTAIFNTNNTVDMGSGNAIMALTMSAGIDLSTSGFDLLVDGLVDLSGNSTNLFIGGGESQVDADDVTIDNGAAVELVGGTLIVNQDALLAIGGVEIGATGDLVGHGTVNLVDSGLFAATLLDNNGVLFALTRVNIVGQSPPANTLAINATAANARVDLDGSAEGGIVSVGRNQTLDINGTLSDVFNGDLNLAQNTTFDVSTEWTLGAGGTIDVDNGSVMGFPVVPAGSSTIAGGMLTQTGGTLTVVDGDGELIFDAPLTTTGGAFINHGHVTFNATSSISLATFDFDAGEWTIQNSALLSLNITDYDPGVVNKAFDSEITLNNGDLSLITGDPKFVMNGILNMTSTSGITVWDGEPLDVGNDAAGEAFLNVTGTQTSRFAGPVSFKSDAVVSVADGATLSFLNTVTFDSVNGGNNAQFTGAGQLSFSGAITVNEATTLDMVGGTVDLDGGDNSGDLVFIGAPLEIHAQAVSPFGRANGMGGANRITIDALNAGNTGSLTILLDDPTATWTLNPEGEISILSTNAGFTLLAGNDINLNGIVNISGSVFSAARLDIGGFVTLNTPSEGLIFQGGNLLDPNRISGGLIGGNGALGALNNRALVGFGAINADIDFEGTAKLLADDGSLDLGGQILDAGTIGTADEDGVLDVLNAWNSSTVTAVSLNGGELTGAPLTVANPQGVFGHGLVSSRVIVNSQISAVTGTLVLETVGNDNDWDGAANAGMLTVANASTLELRDNATFGFGGSVIAVEQSRVLANGFGLDFNPGSVLQLVESTYESTSSTDIGGTVVIGAGGASTVKVQNNFFLSFESTSTTTLNDNLRLENNNINIEAGATFSGAGALVIPDGSHLVADNLADIGVLLDMQGAFRPGNSEGIGRVDLFDYQQADSGELFVELTGTSLNQFDRLVASGDVLLDGYLNIDIDLGFVPALGNTFNIITANTVAGAFDFADVSGMPAGLAFHIEYLPNAVQLQVVNKPFFSADFDEDGDVDATDYQIWKGAFGLNQLGDATGDNKSTAADYVVWRNQLGSVPGAGAASGLAVPEPAAGVLLLLGLMTALDVRRINASDK